MKVCSAGAFPPILRRTVRNYMSNQSILHHVRVAAPCNARWEDMTGDDRARFCQHCQKHVFNLSAMTRAEAESLIVEKEGKFCGRFHRRTDGRMLTRDCATGQSIRRNRIARWCGAAFATFMLLIGGKVSLRSAETNNQQAGNSTHAEKKPEQGTRMGEVAVNPVTMGVIAVSTNVPPPATNQPPIMGKICIPPANPPATNNTPRK